MNDIKSYVLGIAKNARNAALKLNRIDSGLKNSAIENMAQLLNLRRNEIKEKNYIDLEDGKKAGLSKAMLDRLELNDKRIDSMIDSLHNLISLPDPVGKTIAQWDRPNGMSITKISVPIGVIGIIYESRPNVTVDSASLCLKSGNVTILRGGKESINSNIVLTDILKDALINAKIPEDAIQLLATTDRTAVAELLKLNEYVDLIIPRGGEGLIKFVAQNSTIPVIKHYKGVCHLYADKDIDQSMAMKIIINAKVQRPGVCNAIEKLLVHKDIAQSFIPLICGELDKNKVEIRGDELTQKFYPKTIPANEDDWYEEYLDLILAVKVVNNIEEAVDHIEKYGSHHSDGILTTNGATAKFFLDSVDSAVVYHNVSTRFTDGGEFGMGAEIGISTDKLHARGPMGLDELTSYKYIVTGNGQIRE